MQDNSSPLFNPSKICCAWNCLAEGSLTSMPSLRGALLVARRLLHIAFSHTSIFLPFSFLGRVLTTPLWLSLQQVHRVRHCQATLIAADPRLTASMLQPGFVKTTHLSENVTFIRKRHTYPKAASGMVLHVLDG